MSRPPAWCDPFELPPAGRRLDLFVRVPEEVVVVGVVHEDDGPVSGATVEAGFKIPGVLDAAGGMTVRGTVSGSDGRFRIDGLPPAIPVQVRASKRGYREGHAMTGGFVSIHLERGVTVEGRVIPAVGGISVTATQGSGASVSDRTDAEGRFRLEGLDPRSFTLTVQGEGWVTRVLDRVPADRPVEVRLTAAGVVTGRVEGARGPVWICYDADRSRIRRRASDDGTFVLESVPPGARLDVEDGARRVLASVVLRGGELTLTVRIP
jgi:hypothetical protein